MRLRDLRTFLGELATFLQSGVPIREALESLARGRNRRLAGYAGSLAARIGAGMSLGEAMRDVPGEVPPAVVAVVEAGEQSGTLDQLLRRLADEAERELEVRGKLITRTGYPALCVLLAVVLLPVPLVVIGKAWLYALIEIAFLGGGLTAGALVFLASRTRGRRPALRATLERFVLAVPILGGAVYGISLGRALRLFGSLIEAGLSLRLASALVVESAGVARVGRIFSAIGGAVDRGAPVSDGLARFSAIPDAVMVQVRTGEVSGTLDRAFLESGARVLDDAWRRLDRVVQFVPVALILIIGAAVLLVGISVVQRVYGGL